MIDKKRILSIKREYLIIAVILGIAMMMIGKLGSLENATEAKESNVTQEMSNFDLFSMETSDSTEYISYLTEQVEGCLKRIEGVGEAEVFMTLEAVSDTYLGNSIPIVQGVLVVTDGAQNPVVVKNITEACQALFSLDAHKIKVVMMKEEN